MFINSPPIVLGCSRTGANAFPNQHQFVIPTLHQDAGTPPVLPGDLCVLCDLDNSSSPGGDAAVTPVGFIDIGGTVGFQQNGNRASARVSYKVLVTADIGATKVGMNPSDNARKMVATFRMSRPIQSVQAFGFQDLGPSGTDPGTLNITPSNPVPGTCLLMFMSCAENAHTPSDSGIIGSAPYNVDPLDPEGAAASATRVYYSMFPFGVTAAAASFHQGDASPANANYECGFYLALN